MPKYENISSELEDNNIPTEHISIFTKIDNFQNNLVLAKDLLSLPNVSIETREAVKILQQKNLDPNRLNKILKRLTSENILAADDVKSQTIKPLVTEINDNTKFAPDYTSHNSYTDDGLLGIQQNLTLNQYNHQARYGISDSELGENSTPIESKITSQIEKSGIKSLLNDNPRMARESLEFASEKKDKSNYNLPEIEQVMGNKFMQDLQNVTTETLKNSTVGILEDYKLGLVNVGADGSNPKRIFEELKSKTEELKSKEKKSGNFFNIIWRKLGTDVAKLRDNENLFVNEEKEIEVLKNRLVKTLACYISIDYLTNTVEPKLNQIISEAEKIPGLINTFNTEYHSSSSKYKLSELLKPMENSLARRSYMKDVSKAETAKINKLGGQRDKIDARMKEQVQVRADVTLNKTNTNSSS